MTLSRHKTNIPIISEDVFGWVRDGNALQVRVWLDDTEHDLNQGDDHGFSLLHWASKEGHVTIVDLLLSRGARVNATNMGDDTALHLAAAHGHKEIVHRLLTRKADVNAVNEHGNTALHYACFWGYESIAEDLIQAGTQVSTCNKYGETAVDICRPQIQKTIQEIAAAAGQDLSRKVPYKDTAWKGTKTRSRDATLSRYAGIDIGQLNLSTKIAESHSGELWKGKWQGNEIVARILTVKEVTPRISRDFQEEFPRLRIFSHPNVQPVLACCNQPPNLVVISLYAPYGSLYNVLHEQSGLVIDQTQALRFAIDIARGMSFLHALEPMVLRFFLNSKHVVIDDDLSVKVNMADTKFSFQEKGRLYSPAWMSPEALLRKPEDANIRASDMWSFAVILWELNTREVPFSDMSPMEIGMKIALEGLRVTIPPGTSKSMTRLINICMNEDPGRRPNFEQVLPVLEKMAA